MLSSYILKYRPNDDAKTAPANKAKAWDGRQAKRRMLIDERIRSIIDAIEVLLKGVSLRETYVAKDS